MLGFGGAAEQGLLSESKTKFTEPQSAVPREGGNLRGLPASLPSLSGPRGPCGLRQLSACQSWSGHWEGHQGRCPWVLEPKEGVGLPGLLPAQPGLGSKGRGARGSPSYWPQEKRTGVPRALTARAALSPRPPRQPICAQKTSTLVPRCPGKGVPAPHVPASPRLTQQESAGPTPWLAITRAPQIVAAFPLHGLGVISGKVAQRRTCAGKRAGGRGRAERGFSFRAWGPCRVGLSQAEPHGWEFLETGAVGQGVAGATGSVLGPRVQRLNPRVLCPGVCGLQASMAGPDPCSGPRRQ